MRFSGGCVGEVATMEVPLPVLFPPPCSNGLEDDADDIPPSPTPDPSSSSVASQIFFQRGFLDCAEEAMRFLTDMEGMPENSPVIAGLKEHLVHSSQQFTPTSLAPPSPTFFTFPPSTSESWAMRRKQQHHSSVVSPLEAASHHSCVPSGRSDGVRFSPYTVASHRNASNRLFRAGIEKDSTATETSQISSVLHSSARTPSTTCPLTKSLESVLKDDLISTDDLHGVLKCLQSAQSPGLSDHHHQHLALPDHSQHHLAATVHPSTHLTVPICHQSVQSVHSCTVSSKVNSCSSLNDSGVSADLTDEVDGLGHSAVDSVSDDVFHSGQNCEQRVTEEIAGRENSDLLCSASVSATSLSSSASQSSSSDTPLSSSSLSASSSTTVPTVPESSPSSQLSLLSSLSSGTHRLTAQSGEGSATAARIQSLANEILLLLQEEAEANDNEDEETDVEDDDGEYSDDESDEDSAVEMEP